MSDNEMDGAGSGAVDDGTEAAAEPPEPEIEVTRQGDRIVITAPEELRLIVACGYEPVPITDSDGLRLRNERPPIDRHAGYFVGDDFVGPACNLGCDSGRSCGPLSSEWDIVEYVQVGMRDIPGDYRAMTYSACPQPVMGAGGVPQIPVFERRSVGGDVLVRLRYYAGSPCQGEGQEIILPVPAL